MSQGYERWLIARGNVFAPSAAAVAKLVAKLREERFLPATGGQALRTVPRPATSNATPLPAELTAEWMDDGESDELRLVWSVGSDAGDLRYPLTRRPEGDAGYRIELHRASEFVYPDAEAIGPLPTECPCGEDLEFEWDHDEVLPAFDRETGIFTECEECSRTFDPSKRMAELENPLDGSSSEVPGGAAYRFALKVACGDAYARDPLLAFTPELVALLEKEFGRVFQQVAALR